MKKASILLLCGAAMAMCACSQADSKGAGVPAASTDGNGAPQLTIRYVSQDSIEKYYLFAEVVRQENERLQSALYAYGNQLQGTVQNMQQQFQQKLQNNGFISQAAAEAEANSLQQKAAGFDRQFNARQTETMTKVQANLQALSDSIQHFVTRYAEENSIDAILYRETNLYLNPSLDITQQVVDGLNSSYKAPAPKDEKK